MRHIKILVYGQCGDHNVQFIERYINDKYTEVYDRSTITVYYKTFRDEQIHMEISDEILTNISNFCIDSYFKNYDGIILLYLINNRDSFDCFYRLKDSIKRFADYKNSSIILCGNLSDRNSERVISNDEGQKLASELGCPFFETSPQQNTNITESILCIRDLAVSKKYQKISEPENRGCCSI